MRRSHGEMLEGDGGGDGRQQQRLLTRRSVGDVDDGDAGACAVLPTGVGMPPQGGVDLERRRYGRSNNTSDNRASDDDDNDRSSTNNSEGRGVSFAVASAAATADSNTVLAGGGSRDGGGGDRKGDGGIRRAMGRSMEVDSVGMEEVRRDGNRSDLVAAEVVGDRARGRDGGVSPSPSRRSAGGGRQSGGSIGYGTGGDGDASESDSQSDSRSTRSAGTMCSSNSGSREALLLMMAEEGSGSTLATRSRPDIRADVDPIIGGGSNSGESASAAPLRSLALGRSSPSTPSPLSPLPALLSPSGSIFAKDPRCPEHRQVDEQCSDKRDGNDDLDEDGDRNGRYEMNDVSAGVGTETQPVGGRRRGWHSGGAAAAEGTNRNDRPQTETTRRNNSNSDPDDFVERPLEHADAGVGDDDDDDDDPHHEGLSEDRSERVRGRGVDVTGKGNKRPFSDGPDSSADLVHDPAPDGGRGATDPGPYPRRSHLRRRLTDG